jgi:hypothetical protein
VTDPARDFFQGADAIQRRPIAEAQMRDAVEALQRLELYRDAYSDLIAALAAQSGDSPSSIRQVVKARAEGSEKDLIDNASFRRYISRNRQAHVQRGARGDEMTTDELRRLVERAAKTIGLSGELRDDGPYNDVSWWDDDGNIYQWHRDDGDCARLIAVCQIDVSWFPNSVHCERWRYHHGISLGSRFDEAFTDHNNDRNAALRLCALRVAAATYANGEEWKCADCGNLMMFAEREDD